MSDEYLKNKTVVCDFCKEGNKLINALVFEKLLDVVGNGITCASIPVAYIICIPCLSKELARLSIEAEERENETN